MPRKIRKKPRVLRRRNIKKRIGARAQSRQIMALNRSLSALTRKQFAKVHTTWQRNMLTIESATGGVQAYICPLPFVPCNPEGASQPGGPVLWTDNLSIASQPSFSKKAVFGVAREAATSNEIYHTGGRLDYQIVTNEPTFSKYYIFLVRPKKGIADQLVKDRQLKGFTTGNQLGSAAELTENLDYVVHQEGLTGGTLFAAQMNNKYWTTLYKREVTLGRNVAGAPDAEQIFNYNAPGDPGRTGLTARGTIKLPAGGMIKNAAVQSQTGTGNNGQATSWEVGFGDQENDGGCYLVVINNGVAVDGEACKMGFLVHDWYKACV